ncbi:MAG: hypothetical protein MK066_03285 [Crocinitomicaceae bacterium]|nr:hypothetical protein [Crocinitomicaceae bacterium]
MFNSLFLMIDYLPHSLNIDIMNISQEKYFGLTKRQRATITLHGMLVIVVGSFAGFAWLISLCGSLELWPIPPIELSLPDQKELWRNAHLGPIGHGMIILLIAALAPLLKLTKREASIMVYATLVEVWFNVLGFQSAPYTTNRGLTADGSFINIFSYSTFYVAVMASFVILTLSIMGSYRTMKTIN